MTKIIKITITILFISCFNSVTTAQAKPTPNDPMRACGKAIFQGHPNEIMQVKKQLSVIKTNCKKGVLVDEKNKPLRIVQNYCPPGMPPREGDGREKAQKAIRDEIIKLKKKYRVVTYNCYPPRP